MIIAVTGSSGQLGSHCLRRLVARADVTRVRCLDLRPPCVVHPKLEHHRTDVRDPAIGERLRGSDAVMHFAFLVTAHPGVTPFREVNVEGSRNVFEAAARERVPRVVYTSSIAAYGVVKGHSLPLREDSPRVRQDDFAYAACKWDVEDFLDRFEPANPTVAVARLRPAVLLGEGMEHPLGMLLARRLIALPEGPAAPLVWDEDVADAALLALDAEGGSGARGAFNLQAREGRTAGELARDFGLTLLPFSKKTLLDLAAYGPTLSRLGFGPATDPAWIEHSEASMEMDCSRARSVLGWNPRCATATAVMRRFCEEVPTQTDPRIATFARWLGEPWGGRRVHGAPVLNGALQLRVRGRLGGTWGLRCDNGVVRATAGAARPPASEVTLAAPAMCGLLMGERDPRDVLADGTAVVMGEDAGAELFAATVRAYVTARAGRGIAGLVLRALG